MAAVTAIKNIVNRLRRVELNTSLRLILVCVLIGLAIGAYHIYKVNWPTAYVAQADGFKIDFPQTPTINTIAPKSDGMGGQESGRIYNDLNQSKGVDYIVYVTHYSNFDSSTLSASATTVTLQSDVEQLAQTDSAKLSNGETTIFEGLTAVEATLTPSNNSNASTIVLAFLNKDNLYIILCSGVNQSKFESFAKTFHFIS